MISHAHIRKQLCPSSLKTSMGKDKETTIQVSGTLQIAGLKQSDKIKICMFHKLCKKLIEL